MSQFEQVTMRWDGKQFVIPANRMMGAIARIEDVITLQELRGFAQRGGAPVGKLAMAYGALLRYAGCEVEDDDIYVKLFSGGDEALSIAAVKNVLLMMVPPSIRKRIDAGEIVDDEKDTKPGNGGATNKTE